MNSRPRRSIVPFYLFAIPALAISLDTFSHPVFAQTETKTRLVEYVAGGKGTIDWQNSRVQASGYGPPQTKAQSAGESKLLARVVAIADAQRRLAEVISGIRVEGKTTIRNLQVEDDTIITEVKAILQNARIVSEEMQSDGNYKVVIEIPIYGRENSVISVVNEKILPQTDPVLPPAAAAAVIKELPPVTSSTPPDTTPPVGSGSEKRPDGMIIARVSEFPKPAAGEYTSVIVDAVGLGLAPGMSPKILDETGNEVYGSVNVSPMWAIEHGVVSYPPSMAAARKVPRCGDRPIVVKALKVSGPFKMDVVISNEDARKIQDADSRSGFFAACAVIFVGR